MKRFLIGILLLLTHSLMAQELVVDPAVTAAIAVNATLINSQLDKTNDKLNLIQQGQLAVSSQLLVANNLQNKIYQGLTQVAAVVNNLTSVKQIYDCGTDIVSDVESALKLAQSNPALLLFAEQGARDFQSRAVNMAAEVSAFVVKGGGDNLMDAGERGKLLNHIASEMQILRGIAYGMNRAMYWAKLNGIFRSLNPWATWQNHDVQIAKDVIANAKYLRR